MRGRKSSSRGNELSSHQRSAHKNNNNNSDRDRRARDRDKQRTGERSRGLSKVGGRGKMEDREKAFMLCASLSLSPFSSLLWRTGDEVPAGESSTSGNPSGPEEEAAAEEGETRE